ncbi:MAG: hypothetical protein JWN78_823 [Bacteroidota bacterium]|nr:hypothetical protein [Bacteroidota bacterium]
MVTLASAVCYTLIIPILRNSIHALNAWAFRWGNKWSLDIAKGSVVDIERYLTLRDSYKTNIEMLAKIIAEEKKFENVMEQTNTMLLQTQNELQEYRNKITEQSKFVTDLYDARLLNGRWNKKMKSSHVAHEEEVIIEDSKYFITQEFGEKKYVASIQNFIFDNRTNNLFFMLNYFEPEIKSKPYIAIAVKIETMDLFVGQQDGVWQVEYKRK